MTAKARLPPASFSTRSNGEIPYIMKYLQQLLITHDHHQIGQGASMAADEWAAERTYNRQPNDQTSTRSSIVHWEGTSKSSGAL